MINDLWLILLASLLGSFHCAAMCGAFSVIAGKRSRDFILYHVGRLTSYFILTSLVYFLARPIREMVSRYQVPLLSVTITVFLLALWLYLVFSGIKINIWFPRPIAEFLSRHRGGLLFSGILGLTTSLLPCFWLYGFVGIAAAKPTYLDAIAVITFFWMGTLPSLALVQTFSFRLNWDKKRYLKSLAVLILIVSAGISTFHRVQHLKHSTGKTDSCH